MTKVFVSGALLAGLVAFSVVPTVAADDATDKARVQFQHGVELFEQGKFEQAAIAFARAYEIKPSYKILFNIGQAENLLQHYAAALEAYTRYLLEGGEEVKSERRAFVRGEITRLNSLVGMIVVECPIEQATVMVDGEIRGQTPLAGPVSVDLGRHEIEISKKGERLHRQVFKIAGGERVTVKVEVVDEGAEGIGPAVRDEPAGPTLGEPASNDGETGESGIGPVPFYVSAAVTGALGLATIGLEIGTQRAASDLEDDPSDKVARDRGKTLQITERVLLGLTGAAAVTTVVLLILTDFDEQPERGEPLDAVVTPMVGDGTAGLGVSGRF